MKFGNHAFKAMVILGLVFAAFANPVYSQGTAAQKKSASKALVTWKQEPTSLIGITLDQPLTSSAKECPKGEGIVDICVSSVENPIIVCCVQIETFKNPAYVHTSDMRPEGKVGSIQLNFESEHFQKVADILIVKYGTPHMQKVNKVKTKGGAEFDSVEMSWIGANVRILATSLSTRFFSEIQGRLLEHGTVVVWTASYARQEAAKSDEATRKRADKL